MTARTRLLASDLTTPGLLDATKTPTICFDEGITAPSIKETGLRSDVYVQVVDIEDLSKSRWEQVEELEAVERGEQTRGREFIRLPVTDGFPGGDAEEPAATATVSDVVAGLNAVRNGTHRVVLQDCKGQKVYGLELVRMPEISIGTLNIGGKILLKKGAVVARGMVLLEPTSCQFLGGRVEVWQKEWLDGRLARLREVAEALHTD